MVIKIIKKQMGLSIFELLFFLVIAGMLVILGIRQYQMLRLDNEAQQAQANVNTILQAMGTYYKANCFGTYAPGDYKPGTLNPDHVPPPQPQYPINIKTDLIQAGFLNSPNIFYPNPFINSAGAVGTSGYVAQFNQSTSIRYICTAANCAQKVAIGTIISWQAQVAFLTTDPSQAATYKDLLNADCTSSINGSTVQPCSSNRPGPYLVWERLPSMASPPTTSAFWPFNPTVKQFNQMYTTYPINYLMSTVSKDPTMQYFLCGQ